MVKPLQEFTPFIWWMQTERHMGCQSAGILSPSTSTIACYYYYTARQLIVILHTTKCRRPCPPIGTTVKVRSQCPRLSWWTQLPQWDSIERGPYDMTVRHATQATRPPPSEVYDNGQHTAEWVGMRRFSMTTSVESGRTVPDTAVDNTNQQVTIIIQHKNYCDIVTSKTRCSQRRQTSPPVPPPSHDVFWRLNDAAAWRTGRNIYASSLIQA